MDFLNKASAQFNDLFRSMTPGARITAGLLLAVVVISLVYLFSYQMSSSDTYLMGGRTFKSDELGRIQAALGKNNLNCTAEGMRILIPRGQETKCMAALAEEGALPRSWNNMGDGLDGGGTLESPAARKARLKRATEANLAFCISEMSEVENARVMFDRTTEGGLYKRVVSSASVTVSSVGGGELSQRTVNGIRGIVSGAFAQMKPEDVTVVNVSTGTPYFADNGAKSGMHGNRYHKLTQDWQDERTKEIMELLSYIRGIKAHVSVKLDTTESLSATTITPDKKGTAVSTIEKEINREHEGAPPSGRPGSVSNRPLAIRQTQGRGSTETEGETESTTTNVVGGKTEHTTSVGMTPTWMSATVIVPHSYLASVWKQKNPTAEGEDPKTPPEGELKVIEQEVVASVQQDVANMLPDMKDVADKTALVKVTVARDIKPEPIPEPSMTTGAISWLSENWGTLGMVVLAFASLGMLRSVIKSTSIESPAAGQTSADLTLETAPTFGNEDGAMAANATQRRLANFAKGGASLRDELADMVKEDPDAAASILRTWIDTPSIKA